MSEQSMSTDAEKAQLEELTDTVAPTMTDTQAAAQAQLQAGCVLRRAWPDRSWMLVEPDGTSPDGRFYSTEWVVAFAATAGLAPFSTQDGTRLDPAVDLDQSRDTVELRWVAP